MTATILIADDYEDNLELLRLMLAAGDYHVREARDGEECLEIARETMPDLIMVDLSMPVVDGWGVCQELKSDQRTAAIPCVAVTAYGDSDRERALQAGFDAYISKPFRGAELLGTVSKLLADPSVKAKAAPHDASQDWQTVVLE
jgi:CheY-like chemotaxis protein